jgi:hypothetical protein
MFRERRTVKNLMTKHEICGKAIELAAKCRAFAEKTRQQWSYEFELKGDPKISSSSDIAVAVKRGW